MSLIAKLYIEDKVVNILDFKFRFTRSVDERGKPMGRPNGTLFDITFETTSDQSFFAWSVGMDMVKKVRIVVSPVTRDSKSRVFELFDVHCVFFKNHFNGVNGKPMTTQIKLSPALLYDGGHKILDHYWKETDLSAQDTPVTTLQKEENFEVLSAHFENKERKKITELEKGTAYLVIHTKNGDGKSLEIDLTDRNHDFNYQGKKLENDILKDVSVIGDKTTLELEIIDEQET
ncbi:type VI secretion system tube protein TssD [Rapidithrix thailandica]|uniref:Type VI secretion system tube protein TssD n=1 Tax=Rapidithrix thailandica TaxID=413964 RepID=A0AAW9S4Q3_9BACT